MNDEEKDRMALADRLIVDAMDATGGDWRAAGGALMTAAGALIARHVGVEQAAAIMGQIVDEAAAGARVAH